MKHENEALWNGEFGGPTIRINDDEWIYAFKREKNGNQVIGIINMSAEAQSLNLTDQSVAGTYNDYFTQEKFSIGTEALSLQPWQYLIFTSN